MYVQEALKDQRGICVRFGCRCQVRARLRRTKVVVVVLLANANGDGDADPSELGTGVQRQRLDINTSIPGGVECVNRYSRSVKACLFLGSYNNPFIYSQYYILYSGTRISPSSFVSAVPF
jgi:hypothetical protein